MGEGERPGHTSVSISQLPSGLESKEFPFLRSPVFFLAGVDPTHPQNMDLWPGCRIPASPHCLTAKL